MFSNIIGKLEQSLRYIDDEIRHAMIEHTNALVKVEQAAALLAKQQTERAETQNAINLLKINEGIVNQAGHDRPNIPSPNQAPSAGVAACPPSNPVYPPAPPAAWQQDLIAAKEKLLYDAICARATGGK